METVVNKGKLEYAKNAWLRGILVHNYVLRQYPVSYSRSWLGTSRGQL